MAVDVRPEVLIRRPRAEVASYMFDPRHDAEWTGGVVASKPLTEGPLRTGSRVERVSRFLGREFAYLVEVTAAEPEAFVQMRVTQPFPMQIRYELRQVPEGTLASIHATGEPGGFFRVAGPLLGPLVKRNIASDLRKLRDRLEAGTN